MITSCQKENSQTGTDEQQVEASMASSEADSESEIVFNGILMMLLVSMKRLVLVVPAYLAV